MGGLANENAAFSQPEVYDSFGGVNSDPSPKRKPAGIGAGGARSNNHPRACVWGTDSAALVKSRRVPRKRLLERACLVVFPLLYGRKGSLGRIPGLQISLPTKYT